MTRAETANATAATISSLASNFMLDPATYTKGTELGHEGMNFYVAGRGGALGLVDGDVVAASFYFFNPVTVRAAWEGSAVAQPRREAAAAFMDCGHRWARAHLADGVNWSRLAELAYRIADAASPAGAPVFAAWRSMPRPDPSDAKASALHAMNLLRELRMGNHGCAILAAGVTPLEALMVKQPYMAQIFGWSEPFPDPEPARGQWEEAEAATDELFGASLAVLSEQEQSELIALCTSAAAAVT